ncbi:MAG: EAL domain-containing protein [Granulosicoccus sp.]
MQRVEELEKIGSSVLLGRELDALLTSTEGSDHHGNLGMERLQFEALLIKAVELSKADYAFILSPSGVGAYAEQFVKLNAAVERIKTGEIQPCYDTLTSRLPDPMILSVMRLQRGIKGAPTDIGLPLCLPSCHPPISYFFMIPIKTGVSRTSVLFLANPDLVPSKLSDESLMEQLLDLVQVLSAKLSDRVEETPNTLSSSSSDDGARHYVQLMSASINAVVILDVEGFITAFNPAAEKLFGRGCASALGTNFDRFVSQDFLMPILKRAKTFDTDQTIRDVLPVYEQTVVASTECGNTLHLYVSGYFTRLDDVVYSTFVFSHEVQSLSIQDNSSVHLQFKALTNVAPVGIVQLGVDWTCEYANEMWCHLSGLSMDESMQEGWVDAIHAEDVVDTLVQLRETLSENQMFSRNLRLQRPTGKICWVTLSATVTINEMGHFTGCLLALLDVTEAHLASEKLRYAASHDALTGLANRSSFLDKLQALLNERQTRIKTALLYLDLDGFKTINDTLGHDCGDELLRKVAERLQSAISSHDICARLGGDEFTIIFTSDNKLDVVCNKAERIVRDFNETFDIFGNQLHLSTSIGIAIGDDESLSSDVFIKQADTALYKAKSSGRSRWVVYTREFQHEDIRRSELEARVRKATERQEFTLVYQPQFRIDNQDIVSFEALLRWSPSDIDVPNTQLLVNVLEESGLINDVGQWVLETACLQFKQWEQLGLIAKECTISVNVSPAQLSLANFIPRLERILERCELPPQKLNLEITESALIEKNSSCIWVIEQIKKLGVKLSLDDFGTGYASLSYLTRLPIDHLKIDKSFVMAMESKESSRTIVMSVLAMAETLKIDVVAEGIENSSTLAQLKAAKCQYGQGYLISKPLASTEIEAFLVKRNLNSEEVMAIG